MFFFFSFILVLFIMMQNNKNTLPEFLPESKKFESFSEEIFPTRYIELPLVDKYCNRYIEQYLVEKISRIRERNIAQRKQKKSDRKRRKNPCNNIFRCWIDPDFFQRREENEKIDNNHKNNGSIYSKNLRSCDDGNREKKSEIVSKSDANLANIKPSEK